MLLQPRFQCDGWGLGTAWGQATRRRLPLHASAGTPPCRLLLLGTPRAGTALLPAGVSRGERVGGSGCRQSRASPASSARRRGPSAGEPCVPALRCCSLHGSSSALPRSQVRAWKSSNRERDFEHPCPSAGAEVVPSWGLEKPRLCEEAVQMDFPSCINQFEGSKGS